MNFKLAITMHHPRTIRTGVGNLILFVFALMPKVVIKKKPRILRHVFL